MPEKYRPRHWPRASYDPKYDPLVDAGPGHKPGTMRRTYWIGTAGAPPEDDGPVSHDMDVDVVVIGSGYTGLSHGHSPGQEPRHQGDCAGGQHGGLGLFHPQRWAGTDLLGAAENGPQWIERWGVDTAKLMHREVCEAFELFNDLINSDDIDCDPQTGGHYYIAHRAKVMPKLEKESALLNDTFGYKSRVIGKDETARRGMCAIWKRMARCGSLMALRSTRPSWPSAMSVWRASWGPRCIRPAR